MNGIDAIAPIFDEYGFEELDQSVYDELGLYELEQAEEGTAQADREIGAERTVLSSFLRL